MKSSRLYKCSNGCEGTSRKIIVDSEKSPNLGWPPKFPKDAGPCLFCPTGRYLPV